MDCNGKVSRRSFLKGAAVSAVGFAAMGLVSGCGTATPAAAPTAAPAAPVYTPGTYTATAKGMGDVTVTMTFSETSITDVQLDLSGETDTIGQAAGDTLRQAILDAQSSGIDGVSGATMTSNAVKTAAADCISQAKGLTTTPAPAAAAAAPKYYRCSTDWLGEAPAVSDSDIAETVSADVVIVGSGHAGIQAALAASEAGASVAVIESQTEEAFTVLGEDIGCWNAQWLLDKGFGPYNEGEVVNEFVRRSAGRVNPEIISMYVKNSGEMFDNCVSIVEETGDPEGILAYSGGDDGKVIVQVQKGVTSYPIECGGYKTWATTPQFMGEISHEVIQGIASRSNLPILEKDCIAKAISYGKTAWYYEHKAIVLCKDSAGAVTGCIAQKADGSYVKFVAAKGTIVATGDFASNAEMCWNLLGEASEWGERNGTGMDKFSGPFGRDGYGHKMLCWAGAVIEPAPRGTMNIGGGPGGPWGQAPFFWLNASGKRFTNEACVPTVMGTASRQPYGLMCAVTDSKYMQNVCMAGLEHGGPNYGRPVYYEEMEEDMGKVLDAGADGYSVRGVTVAERNPSTVYGSNDLEELLGFLGYEGEAKQNALDAVAHYNELCAAGADTDFGKDAKCMIPIDEPPYYGVRGQNAGGSDGIGLVTLAGVMTDASLNVLDAERNPIKGLYVAGNTLGGRYGIGYVTPCAGNSIGMAMTHGRCVGKIVAAL